MGRPSDGSDDVTDDEPWQPPGMSPLKKVGLTLLMVMLGVIPGLLLLASDPLPDSSDEVAPESGPPERVATPDEGPARDAVFSPDVAPPAPPTPASPAEDEVGIEPDEEDKRDDRDERPRSSHTRDERDDRLWQRDEEDGDEDADDPDDEAGRKTAAEPDDDRLFISLRLGRWGWG